MKLILIRGLPGSGKSTLAKRIASGFGVHVEADMFFTDIDGKYVFDISKIKEAHQWCQERTRHWLTEGAHVIVSNTFTTAGELRPYFDIAKEFDIVPNVILAQNNFGNVHDVPAEALERMKQRFQYDISELYK
jgi:predicted kinase